MSKITHRARRIIERYLAMKTEKQNWLALYELCAEYVMSRKQGFTTTPVKGGVQTENVFDDTAPNSNSLMAAALIGSMWPNGAKSFRIAMPFGMEVKEGETDDVKKYYEFVTKRMAEYMDNPKCGLATALEEYMLDQGAFGISGIMIDEQEDDLEVPLAYRAVDAKALHIDEGKNGFVNTIFVEREYGVRQLVEEYGYENISSKWRAEFDKGECTSKVKVLHAIEPRMDADPYGYGNKNMPIASIHIDLQTEKIMRETGFLELPVAVTRFWKAMGEKYGRCPAMQALPSILEANSLGEAWILAVEKTLDPTLLVLDDGSMGGGQIDTSPGGLVVVSVSGRIGAGVKPVEPLFLVGDLQWTAARRTELIEIIKNHFFIDRLMDLNNEQRMTLGEANLRDGLRGQTLNPTYSRQFGEQFVPLIETTFNKLRRRGLLGVLEGSKEEQALLEAGIEPTYIPEQVARRMLSGQEVYKIEFISPAARIMHSEELKGIEHLLITTEKAMVMDPSAVDNIDFDFTLRRTQELDGAPREMIRSLERLQKIRDDRMKAQMAMAQIEQDRQNSETFRNVGQAVSSVSGQKGAA